MTREMRHLSAVAGLTGIRETRWDNSRDWSDTTYAYRLFQKDRLRMQEVARYVKE